MSFLLAIRKTSAVVGKIMIWRSVCRVLEDSTVRNNPNTSHTELVKYMYVSLFRRIVYAKPLSWKCQFASMKAPGLALAHAAGRGAQKAWSKRKAQPATQC